MAKRFLLSSFNICKICRCIGSKHISKQKADVLVSSKPHAKSYLSGKVSSVPGHPPWCCCLTVRVNSPFNSFRMKIAVLCGVVLYFAFLFLSYSSTRKKEVSWVGISAVCFRMCMLQLGAWLYASYPVTVLGTLAQILFLWILSVGFERKKSMCVRGWFIWTWVEASCSVVEYFGAF